MAKGRRRIRPAAERANRSAAKRIEAGAAKLRDPEIDRRGDRSPLPARVRGFVFGSSDGTFALESMVDFWSQPRNVGLTRGDAGHRLCDAMWHLALAHLRLRMFKEARALTVNASFVHECRTSSIEAVRVALDGSPYLTDGHLERTLPRFFDGMSSARSPGAMEEYNQRRLPEDYSQMEANFPKMPDSSSFMRYVDEISDDWDGAPYSRKGQQSSAPTTEGTQIRIFIADAADEDEKCSFDSFDISPSTPLKTLFNDYASQRGISLRSLRFSYSGKTLFLSSAGNKTPGELNMQDQGMIRVCNTSLASNHGNKPSQKNSRASLSSSKKTKANVRLNKKSKGKGKRRQQHAEANKPEEYKARHFKQLTKVHDEARDQFKLIRQRLNCLNLKHTQPKLRHPRAPKNDPSIACGGENSTFSEGVERKPGRSRYEIHVGEVQNLYKTTKPSAIRASHAGLSAQSSTLDLHGCTREEALARLDESLEAWHNAAMRGSYPFVVPATIVCGGGSQVLSEAVQDWIRSTDRVANVPQSRSKRHQRGHP